MSLSFSKHEIFSEFWQSLRLSLPLIAANVVQSASGFLGTVMVAHLGKDALAATALGFAVYLVLIVFAFGFLSSVGVLVAQSFGAKNHDGVRLAVTQGFLLSFIMSIPAILIIYFAPHLIVLAEKNQHVIQLSKIYLSAVSWSILPIGFLIVMEQFFVGISRSRLVLWISLVEVPLEIFACYALIFGKFGFPNCGVAGVGYGFAAVFVLLILIMAGVIIVSKGCREYKIFSHLFEFCPKYFFELLNVGWPVGCMNIVEVALVSAIAFLMGNFGSDQLAAHQVTRQFWVIGMMFVWSIAQAAMVRVGQAVGRNDRRDVILSGYVNMVTGFAFIICIASVYWLFPRFLIHIDINVNDAQYFQLVHFATLFLLIAGISQLFDNFRFIAIGALRGLKDTRVPLYISIITFWFIGLPIGYLLAFVFHLNGVGLWIGLGTGVASGAIILCWRFRTLSAVVDLSKLLI